MNQIKHKLINKSKYILKMNNKKITQKMNLFPSETMKIQ